MKKAFTMIELIFIIFIIGILSIVALPKLLGVQDQAHAVKAGEFVNKLNSIVLPGLYAKAVLKGVHEKGNKFAIANLGSSGGGVSISDFRDLIEIPKNFTINGAFDDAFIAKSDKTSINGPFITNAINNIFIWCRDGNETEFPRCWYNVDGSTPNADDLNVSRSSF